MPFQDASLETVVRTFETQDYATSTTGCARENACVTSNVSATRIAANLSVLLE